MKSYREELWFCTKGKIEFVNITQQIEEAVRKSGIKEGLALVNAMHITASVYINDAESGLLHDYQEWLAAGSERKTSPSVETCGCASSGTAAGADVDAFMARAGSGPANARLR